jgi:hypothetical protein
MFMPDEVGPANAAMETGRYAEAGSLYERAAVEAHRAGDTLVLRMMAVLAVSAYVRAGDIPSAMRFATATVDLLQSVGMVPEIPGVARKMLNALRDQGHPSEADALSARVGQIVGAAWSDPGAPKLAAFCSSCGAAVKPAEIVHPTPSTSACRYCGANLAR